MKASISYTLQLVMISYPECANNNVNKAYSEFNQEYLKLCLKITPSTLWYKGRVKALKRLNIAVFNSPMVLKFHNRFKTNLSIVSRVKPVIPMLSPTGRVGSR